MDSEAEIEQEYFAHAKDMIPMLTELYPHYKGCQIDFETTPATKVDSSQLLMFEKSGK